MSALILLLKHNAAGSKPVHSGKRKRSHPDWEEKNKMSLFTKNIIIHVKIRCNLKKTTQTNKWLNKITRYKMDIYKVSVSLYTKNEQKETEV